jgi:hypothetical protein
VWLENHLPQSKVGNFFVWASGFLSEKITNLVMPLYYRLAQVSHSSGINKSEIRDKKIVISLTSFPARINKVWLTIESIMRQTIEPDVIVLWLGRDEFEGIDSLPKSLKRQQKRGLSIEFCEDLKSHKKYYYAFQKFKNDLIITVDDDVHYPNFMIEKLVELHEEFPTSICCNRAHLITLNEEGKLNKYKGWLKNPKQINGPTKALLPTGVGGVLYPPNSVDEEVFNKENIKKLCLFADDIWLKVMSLKKGTSVVKTENFPRRLFTVAFTQKIALWKKNVINGRNDLQLTKILEYYHLNLNQLINKK